MICCLFFAACGEAEVQGPKDLLFSGSRLDAALESAPTIAAPLQVAAPSTGTPGIDPATGLPIVTWDDLTLPDDRVDDLVDALLYPESYSDEERAFPANIAELDGKEIIIEGFMIPLEWEGEKVLNFMLVGDILACCFGGAPEPDAWIDAKMEAPGADYFVQLPILVRGIFHIEGLDDGTGYAAGCYTLEASSMKLNE